MNTAKMRKGFTVSFMKFMLVIGILVVLAAMAVPQFSSYRARSSTATRYEVDYAEPSLVRVYTSESPTDAAVAPFNTEEYDRIYENRFKEVSKNPLSTFSIDVDTASYSNVRRFILRNQTPPRDAVRIEEMINYFNYDYPRPEGEDPFSIITESSQCLWNPGNRLIHIGLQGKSLNTLDLQPCNLVFLIDSSGSMRAREKLPLLKKAFRLFLEQLKESDRVAIVAYAGSAGLVLPSTPASHRQRILQAMENLRAGGSTAGGAGIRLAYRVAKENLIENGNNRVILATDGDFNVGVSSTSEMVRLIEEKRRDGIYLTICGFGMGNTKDGRMEQISNAGNGNYFYIDNIREAEKVFVTEMRATLFTIAKDVKIQVEFNPVKVKAYRLLGYENRLMAREDFNDDRKDAGELGAGHTVTALYEVMPVGSPAGSSESAGTSDPLKYQKTRIRTTASESNEIMTIKLRYKRPVEEVSRLVERLVMDQGTAMDESSENFRFAAAVAGFGMLLRDSEFKGNLTYGDVIALARGSRGRDEHGYRAEFITLVKTCALLFS
ncbi:MAG: von Willebrand factor type A domain-containing protein [Pseudomonadota bacterium]